MKRRLVILGKLFLLLLVIYALLRLAFLFNHFPNEKWTIAGLAKLCYWGWRVDFASLLYINVPFLLLYFFAEPFVQHKLKTKWLVIIFSVINLPFIALNFLDIIYFKYTHRRSTVDLVDVFSDSSTAFGSFLKQYWYVLLIFIASSILFIALVRKIFKTNIVKPSKHWVYFISTILILGLSFGFARGFAHRPIFPSTPLLYFDSRLQPLVNNSTFNFIYSVLRRQTVLEKKNYFSNRQLDSLYSIEHHYQHDSPFKKKNVVIFVLESFSKDFFKGGPQQAYMPFFDSLMQHSTVFNNAYCNALESNKGLPAILGSLPDVMDEPIYLSNYANIPLKGFGHILKEQGYNTSFFMGAEYDHFGFARLCKSLGIDDYYSKDTYGKHAEHYDGNWGIYDEYFFSYFAKEVAKKKQPFFSVLFNLSSHTPYAIPAETARKIKVPGQKDHQNAITYVDYCFRQLFSSIKLQPWFNNTIFLFVADHGYRYEIKSNNILTEIQIPLFIYDPKQPVHQQVDRVVKQLDVVPSLMDKLNYSQPFTSFGTSFYRESPAFSINRLNGVYQYIDSSDFIGYDDRNEQLVFHYQYKSDSLLQHNRVKSNPSAARSKEIILKAYLQRVYNQLINR
jgi:phosphoglycerol transferase MdoB-like AlkP superfamily enzyme